MNTHKHYTILKWLVMLLAYGYLTYQLVTFPNYNQFFSQWHLHTDWWWLVLVLLLFPFNWGFEALKWKYIVSHLESLPFPKALASTLSGATTGFFTPARLGDYPGRSLYLSEGHRLPSIALGFFGSLALNAVIMVFGLPSTILFFCKQSSITLPTHQIYLIIGIAIGVLTPLYFSLPWLSSLLLKRNITRPWLKNILEALCHLSIRKLWGTLGLSALRYTVFCLQLFCMLRFFGVELTPYQAVIAIATNYLFVTLTPAFAFSEAAIRGSYAILFIGAFTPNLIGVTAAGIGLWVVNYCLPMLIGSIVFARSPLK